MAIRDFNGHEVYRAYTDLYGKYNGLAPSTFTANLPQPSGYAPAMYSTCLNDRGDGPVADPHTLSTYGDFCFTWQFMPGTTTYLDTPMLPQAAFAADYSPVDCAYPDSTPKIDEVVGGAVVAGGSTVTLRSEGAREVPNPAYEGPTGPTAAKTITRNYGFGDTQGQVFFDDVAMTVSSWTDAAVDVAIPAAMPAGAYQVTLERDNGLSTIHSITITVQGVRPDAVVRSGDSIQAAIDAANPGDLIMVEPGVYEEMVIMWKPVRLQGSGAGSTVIDAARRPLEKVKEWQDQIDRLIQTGTVDLLPGQGPATLPFAGSYLFSEVGAGVTVIWAQDASGDGDARIDGFTIRGGKNGGGIYVNGWAHRLQISNNHVTANDGNLHGGNPGGAAQSAHHRAGAIRVQRADSDPQQRGHPQRRVRLARVRRRHLPVHGNRPVPGHQQLHLRKLRGDERRGYRPHRHERPRSHRQQPGPVQPVLPP